jgi:hypothetical protein
MWNLQLLHRRIFDRKFPSLNGESNSQALIRADEYCRPVPVIKGVGQLNQGSKAVSGCREI